MPHGLPSRPPPASPSLTAAVRRRFHHGQARRRSPHIGVHHDRGTAGRGRSARLAGVTPHDAAGFISAGQRSLPHHFLRQFEAAQSELTALSEVIARLGQPRRYPAACLLSPFLSRATAIINALPATIPAGVLSEEQQQLIAVRAFQDIPTTYSALPSSASSIQTSPT